MNMETVLGCKLGVVLAIVVSLCVCFSAGRAGRNIEPDATNRLAPLESNSGYIHIAPPQRYRVTVRNQILPGALLLAHCKSKNDDLGLRKLTLNQYFDWEFDTNVWGTTLFWCNFDWVDSKHTYLTASFDVYKRNLGVHPYWNVSWSIRSDGSYLYDLDTKSYKLMQPWRHGKKA